jgi:helix-turn-helix, Psq domain
MPPPNSTSSVQREGRIALALDAYKQGYFTSFRAAARTYDVSWKTLSRRVRGQHSRRDTRPTNCKLTATEELTLVN